MRAMAILYIGPHLNPDFATDYHISPILTPSQLLANFPPLLMQCGEKDPFVDDTIIFAGRVREAKRQRKHELVDLLSKTSVPSQSTQIEWQEELERLNGESEEDWVQMQIFSDWSHGYLQMPALMKEAGAAINDLADWINDAFNTLGPAAQSADVSATANGAAEAECGTGTNSSGESSSTVHTVAATGQDVHVGLWKFWPWTKDQHQQDMKVQLEGEKGHKANHDPAAIHAEYLQPNAYPTTATETETENDEGITFIPKTRRQSSDVSGTGNGTRRARFSSSTRDVARDIPVFGSPPLTEDLLAGKHSPSQSQSQTKTTYSREDSPEGTVAESFTSSTPPRRSAIPISLRRESQGAASATRPAATTPQSISPPASGKMPLVDYTEVGERKGRDRTRSPEAVKRRSATPGTGSVGGKTGTPVPNSRQTITEAELMRRRRLLDSHIFESE